MDYGLIGKIEKSKRYAEERDRIAFAEFKVTFKGDNNCLLYTSPSPRDRS